MGVEWRVAALSLALASWAAAEDGLAADLLSTDYRVTVNGKPVRVYRALCDKPGVGDYSFASFEVTGPTSVVVETEYPLDKLRVLPERAGVKADVAGKRVALRFERPGQVSVEPAGRERPLLLFADPIEKDVPQAGTAGVVYFGPGVHRPASGKIVLTSGQTLYLAAGAVVKAAVEVRDAGHVRVRGRGILDGTDWPWLKGPSPWVMSFHRCTDVEIEGVTIRGPFAWTLPLFACRDVRISNVKIVGDRVQNDDGINPCNSSHVTIRDCFIRTDDDCIAVKGVSDKDPRPTTDIEVSNSVLWCGRARVVLMGHESQAKEMSRISIRDSAIIHYSMTPFLLEPGEEMPLRDVRVEDVHVNAEGRGELTRLRPVVNQYMKNKVPGRIEGVVFRNVTVDGAVAAGIDVAGADERHTVRDVTFDHVVVNGKPLQREEVRVGPFATDIGVRP